MNSSLANDARRNLKLYPIQKIFNKRVFLPIIPIYYVEYVGFSIPQLGLIAAGYALVNLVVNVPAGYFADKFGRVQALRIGAMSLAISTIFYAAMPTKVGIIIGVLFEAIGFAFVSGAGESLTHDSLDVLDRKHDYSKVLSRAQSIALMLNAVFVALVPLTYAIDPRLPFVLGTAAFFILFAATMVMRDVAEHSIRPLQWRGLVALERLSGNMTLFLAVIFFGIVGAAYFSFDIVAIALRELGIPPEYLGWIYALASLVGAVIGLVVHKLKELNLNQYMLVDIGVLLFLYFAGYIGNIWLFAVAAILSISFWRYRRIIYQDHLLTRFQTRYKATLLSAMNTTESVNMLWVPIVTTAIVGGMGVSVGFGTLGVATAVLGATYFLLMRRAFAVQVKQL